MSKLKYIGNPDTKEFHNAEKLTSKCNIVNVADPKFKRFRLQKDAHEAGYDACGKGCVGRYKSRENS